MGKRKQFRIKYLNHADSQLYTIIQIAPTRTGAIEGANARLNRAEVEFTIVDVVELGSEEYIRQIRKILTEAIERDRKAEEEKKRFKRLTL